MFEDLMALATHAGSDLDRVRMTFDRPLEPCPACGGLLSEAQLEAADAGWIDASCPTCGVILAA